jgi:hypothetical protein
MIQYNEQIMIVRNCVWSESDYSQILLKWQQENDRSERSLSMSTYRCVYIHVFIQSDWMNDHVCVITLFLDERWERNSFWTYSSIMWMKNEPMFDRL